MFTCPLVPRTNAGEVTFILMERGHLDTDTHTERTPCAEGGDSISVMLLQPRIPKDCQQTLRRRGVAWSGFSLTASEEPALLIT